MIGLEIREVCVSDYYAGHIELLSQLTACNKKEVDYYEYEKFINSLNDNHKIYVVIDNFTVIATGTIIIEQKLIHNMGKVGHIEDVVVSEEYRGKKIGSYIINKLVEIAEERGCYKVILDCVEDKKVFYEKMGFTQKNIQMSKYF
jgi:glucosamine-phosphate N-acetyltransferase